MPTAAPVPPGPSMLLLGSATGLLDEPGCPACRYTTQRTDAYFSWLALEGHYDTDVLTGICASRGMCAAHTRRLLTQPGATGRLTAIYRYVIGAAGRDLCARPAPCPACVHAAVASDRVLDILLEDLSSGDRRPYKQHGGLCLPHLRRAAGRRRGVDVSWLIRFMCSRLTGEPPDLELLAGSADRDASLRADLRARLERMPRATVPLCWVCWAAAGVELGQLSMTAPPAGRLCPAHLRDFAPGVPAVLPVQSRLEAARLSQALDGRPRRLGISAWLSPRARGALADPACPVCGSRHQAAADELARLRDLLDPAGPGPGGQVTLCVRHLSDLHSLDQRAGKVAADRLAPQAESLAAELARDFARQAHAGQHEDCTASAPPAWRRAAGFLDGMVFGGGTAA